MKRSIRLNLPTHVLSCLSVSSRGHYVSFSWSQIHALDVERPIQSQAGACSTRFHSCLLAVALVLGLLLTDCSVQRLGGQASGRQFDSTTVKFIELQTRNWEAHGVNVTLDSTGSFVVAAVSLGERKIIRQGRLSAADWAHLVQLLGEANLYALPNQYTGPFKTQFSWWGYQLTLRSDWGVKTIRFHSEDEKVPKDMVHLVNEIQRMTAIGDRG